MDTGRETGETAADCREGGEVRSQGRLQLHFMPRIGFAPRAAQRARSAAAASLVAVMLTACATTCPVTGFLAPVSTPANGASEHTLLVATTRQRDDRPGTMFNGERSPTLSYAELTVSVPPTHVPGKIEFASSAPGDPNTDFVVRDEDFLDGDKAFVAAVNAQLALRPRGKRNVFIYVHGFNTLFAEAAYTATQLINDFRVARGPRAIHLGLARRAAAICLRHQ